MSYHLGSDGQTVHRDETLVALGSTPESAAAIVQRLNSPPARQEDVDLLLWLLAEARDHVDWYHRMGERHLRIQAELGEERDAARATLAFWGVVSGGDPTP